MRILFIAHRIPFPPDKGDKIRSFHELQALAAAGHEVHLIAFADDPRDLRADYQHALSKLCATVSIHRLHRWTAALRALASLASGAPFTLGYFSRPAMRTAVAAALASVKPDAVIVCSSSVAQYVPAEWHSRTLLDMVDVDSEKWRDYARVVRFPRSLLYGTEARRLGAYEQSIVRRFAHTIVTTPREVTTLVGDTPDAALRARVEAVPNGVDLNRFTSDYPKPLRADEVDSPRVVFTGAMDYYANVDAARYFARDVWPRIRAHVSNAQFLVVGSNPTAAVRSLGSLPGVTVTGTVPDVRPYVAGATICVAPLRIARGVQNKVLEAMAMGRAVVATPQAAAGLSAGAGADLVVADGPDALAAAVVSIVGDAELRARIGGHARAFVERHHEWRRNLRRFVEIVEGLSER